MDEDIENYELGNSFAAQKDLMERALATGDEDTVERVLLRITDVRRMAKNGALEWQRPDQILWIQRAFVSGFLNGCCADKPTLEQCPLCDRGGRKGKGA